MRVLLDGLKVVKNSRVRQLGVITVFTIALCFAFAMVIACSKIPDSLTDVPIPVINQDQGYDGSNYGQRLVDELEDSDTANWIISDENLVEDGIENTKYNLAFVIPEDFSQKLLSAKDGDPEQAQVIVYKNVRKNFVMAQLFRIIESEFTKKISSSVTKEYTETAFDSLYDVKDGMKDAVEGTEELQEGADKLDDGATQLSNGIDKLNKGVKNIDVPTVALTDAQKKQISDSAAQQTAGYGQQLAAGVASGVTASIGSSINSSTAKANAAAALQNNTQLQTQIQQTVAAISNGTLSGTDAEQAINSLIAAGASGTLDGAAASVSGSSSTVQQSIQPTISGTISQISSGVAVKTADTLMIEVNDKTSKTLKTVKSTLSDATGQLSDGGHKLADGTGKLSDGVTELHDGLADGQQELEVNLVTPSDKMGEFVAEPLGSDEVTYGVTDNYGFGLAPLFMAIGLWVGALILFILLPPRPRKDLNANRFEIVLGTWAFMSIFGVAEAILISIGVIFFGINLADVPGLFLMTAVSSVSFIAVMEFLVHMLGLGGSSLCVILTAFQICCCEGSFPTNVMPTFFGVLQPFLPMNYAIDGFREVLFAGNRATMMTDIGCLALFAVIFIGLDLIFVHKTEKYVDHIASELGR